ncbi:MAG: hypothetical protein ACRD0B_06385, partial [Acidimicrobiales bacterium]
APYVPAPEMGFLPPDVRRYEPSVSLEGGRDGLDVVRRVVTCAARLLHRGGSLLVELGGDQDEVLLPTLSACGFEAAESFFDEDGDLRGLACRLTRRGSPAWRALEVERC